MYGHRRGPTMGTRRASNLRVISATNDESLHTGSGTTGRAEASPRAVSSALNRLIIAGRSEIMVLAAAARIVHGAERRGRLRAQVERRIVFQHDLAAGVTALGGVPATHASSGTWLAVRGRRVRQVLIGPHEGDAYAACARSTEKTATAYAKVLTLGLPPDVEFGVASQYAEVEWDRRELRRLRWGASLAPVPGQSGRQQIERSSASAPSEAVDARALEVWSEEGGSSPDGSDGTKARACVAGATR